jgi:hypothetical protein
MQQMQQILQGYVGNVARVEVNDGQVNGIPGWDSRPLMNSACKAVIFCRPFTEEFYSARRLGKSPGRGVTVAVADRISFFTCCQHDGRMK